jgi:predicted nucleic acid-binding protein
MTNYPAIIIDASVLVAFYNAKDRYHLQVKNFFGISRSRLITTLACVTEVMWLLSSDYQIQNLFLSHLKNQVYECEPLLTEDFARIVELNTQYADLPGDFADLSLVVISERLNIAAIATLDKDFDIYRRYRNDAFERVFLPKS